MEIQEFVPPIQGLENFRNIQVLALVERSKLRKIQEKQEKKKKEESFVNKLIVAIPKNFMECETTFFLYGEVVVSTNYEDDMKYQQERSNLNKYCKPVLRQEYKKKLRLIEQQLGTSMVGLHNYEYVLQILLSKGDSLLYQVGHWLQKQKIQFSMYRDSFLRIHAQKEQEGTLEQFIEYTNKRFENSLAWCYQYLEQIKPGSYYDFKIGRINYETLNFEIVSSGVSEAFIALLGTTVENFQQITKHRGRTLLMTAKSRLDILIAELKAMSQDQCSCPEPVEIDLLSFDALKIPCKAVYSHLHPNQHLFLHKYDEVLILREYIVSESIITQIMATRKQRQLSPTDSQFCDISLQDDEFEYSAESMHFLEKYYPKIAQKFL